MAVKLTRLLTIALVLAFHSTGAMAFNLPTIDIKNQALSSVRLFLWYQGVEKPKAGQSKADSKKPTPSAPEELDRPLKKYLLAQ